MTASLPPYAEVEAAVRKLGHGADAPELHGGLCGWLAGGGEPGPAWPSRVLADPALPAAEGVLAKLEIGRASCRERV